LQGVSAVKAFYELLSQSALSVLHPEENTPVAPVELCPILKMLYGILITRYAGRCCILGHYSSSHLALELQFFDTHHLSGSVYFIMPRSAF